MNAMRFGLAVLAAAVFGSGAFAADPPKTEGVHEVAAELATNVKKVLEKRNQLGIRVGLFTGSGIDHSQNGGLFMDAVVRELGAAVNNKATLELKGDFFLVEDPNAKGVKTIKVTAVIKDLALGANVKEFPEFVGYVRDLLDTARILGSTAALPPDDYVLPPTPVINPKDEKKDSYQTVPVEVDEKPRISFEDKRKKLLATAPQELGEKPLAPTAHIKGNAVRSHEGSKYEVEILTGPKAEGPFTPLTPTLTNKDFPGSPHVKMEEGHYYRVKIANRDSLRVAVYLHLDGIDQFTFSEDRIPVMEEVSDERGGKKKRPLTGADGQEVSVPKYGSWVVDPGKEFTIKGYHKNIKPGEVFGFLTTEHGKGAASKFPTLSQGKVGTICVSFAAEQLKAVTYAATVMTTVPLETGKGEVIKEKQEETKFVAGKVSEIVTVRYGR
jgi:hypothetical protein